MAKKIALLLSDLQHEPSAPVSKSQRKYGFIGLLAKITQGGSDGCLETQGTEAAVRPPSNPSASGLVAPKLSPPFTPPPAFSLVSLPPCP